MEKQHDAEGDGERRQRVGVVVVFFFQAEDGIRDLTVTGVQTCALPISVAQCLRSVAVYLPSGAAAVSKTAVATAHTLRRSRDMDLLSQDIVLFNCRKIGRAAWRGRGEISGVAGSLKKKKKESQESRPHT